MKPLLKMGSILPSLILASGVRGRQKRKQALGEEKESHLLKLLEIFHSNSSGLKMIKARIQFVHKIILMNLNMQDGQEF